MAENNDLKVIVGLDIPKSVVEIEGDLKIIEKALAKSDEGKLKITAGLNVGKTIGIINKQLDELKIDGSRLKINDVSVKIKTDFITDGKPITINAKQIAEVQNSVSGLTNEVSQYMKAMDLVRDKTGWLNTELEFLFKSAKQALDVGDMEKYSQVINRIANVTINHFTNMARASRQFTETQKELIENAKREWFPEGFAAIGEKDWQNLVNHYDNEANFKRIYRNALGSNPRKWTGAGKSLDGLVNDDLLKKSSEINTAGDALIVVLDTIIKIKKEAGSVPVTVEQLLPDVDEKVKAILRYDENVAKANNTVKELTQSEKELVSINEQIKALNEKSNDAFILGEDDEFDKINSQIKELEERKKVLEGLIAQEKTSSTQFINSVSELQQEEQQINQAAQNNINNNGLNDSLRQFTNETKQIQQELTSLFKTTKKYDVSNIDELRTSLERMGASPEYIDNTIDRLKQLDFTVSELSYTLNQSERDGTAVLGALSAKGFDGIGRTISYLEKFDEKTGEFKKAATHVKHSFEDIRKEEEKLIKETASADKALEKFTKLTGSVDVLSKKYNGEGVPENISNQIDELKSIIEKYKDLFNKDEYKTKPLHDQQQAIIEINNAINSLIVDVNKYEDNIKDSSQQTLSYIDKQKEKTADFRREIYNLYKTYTDVNKTKALTKWKLGDGSELSVKYEEATAAIDAYAVASKKDMTDAKIHVQDVIQELRRLITEEQNAEYAASTLRAKDFNTVKTSTESDVKKFIEQVKNALGSTEPLKSEIDALNESIAALGDSDKSNRVQRLTTVLNNLSNAQSKFEEINELNKSINSLGKSAQSAIDTIDRFNRSAQFRNNNLDDRVIETTKDLADFREEYVKILNELAKNPNAEGLEKIRNNLLELNNRFKDAKDSAQRLKDTLANQTAEINTERRFATLISQVKEYMAQNTKAARKYKVQFENILSQEGVKQSQTSLNNLITQFRSLRSEIKLSGDEGKSFGERIKEAASRFGQWMSLTSLISTAVRDLRKMIQNVIELDTVMTNLRKVTDETEASYSRFLKNAIKQSQELHTTVSDLVEQVAVWSKLGYSLDQAQDLTNVSMIYSKVGEVDNETSVKDLVTIMKAFNIEADDSITIVNRLNKLGNEFATDAASLGQALKVSSAALAESNTSLSETIALITGGVEITQDAGAMGNALRTISMRIRGMKGKLEELGEEFEDVLPVSKLQTQLLNRTKVNILDDENNFRSIYNILKDIAEIYDDLDDPTKADVTELLFGKMRANQGIAIIEAFQSGQIQKAFEAAENSAGSAQAEFERWSQSIEASIETFQSAWQGLSETLISSDLVKGIVDFGTTFLNTLTDIIDKFGTLQTLFPIIMGSLSAFRNVGGHKMLCLKMEYADCNVVVTRNKLMIA